MAEKETPLNVDDISSEPLVANSVLSTDNPVVPEGTPATGGEDIKPKTPSAEDGGGGDDDEDGDGGDDGENDPLIIPSEELFQIVILIGLTSRSIFYLVMS